MIVFKENSHWPAPAGVEPRPADSVKIANSVPRLVTPKDNATQLGKTRQLFSLFGERFSPAIGVVYWMTVANPYTSSHLEIPKTKFRLCILSETQ
ncbi:MAG: hypothetical protein CMJ77_00070 [Planctomycetaceae bacterium]|nr:hypothetical protein [Planctomycetaceae bacterium]